MRKEDCSLNATQILTLANKNLSDSEHLLQLMGQSIKVERLSSIVDVQYSCSWVSFEHGRILCKHLKLERVLQSLIDYGLKLQCDNNRKSVEYVNDDFTRV